MQVRGLLLPCVLFFTVGGLVPLFGTSVYVNNSSFPPGGPNQSPAPTGTFQCQQSGTTSAGCETNFNAPAILFSGEGFAQASAAFGTLNGQLHEAASSGYFVTSFSDNVVVTGGTGSGTLVAHYAISDSADAKDVTGRTGVGSFSFVQGSTKTGVVPDFTNFGHTTPHLNPPPGCATYGLCFSETFDVSSPIQFGTALPFGAETYLNSDGFEGVLLGRDLSVDADSNLNLTGYTVLDASGNAIGDAAVTPQNVPGLDLFPAPEPVSSGLMLLGLGALVMAPRFRGLR